MKAYALVVGNDNYLELFEINEVDFSLFTFEEFKDKISSRLCIPKNKLSMITNYKQDEIGKVAAPWILNFSK